WPPAPVGSVPKRPPMSIWQERQTGTGRGRAAPVPRGRRELLAGSLSPQARDHRAPRAAPLRDRPPRALAGARLQRGGFGGDRVERQVDVGQPPPAGREEPRQRVE